MPTLPKILGIITARGGSKSTHRKNIKPFCGKPLITWSVEAGLLSGVLDRFVLTTDDEEIAAVGKAAGIEVPFMRPAELALDTTPSLPVLQHAVAWLRDNENYYPDYVLLLEPTSPGRQPFHIQEAVELIADSGADSVCALGQVPGHHSPHWQFNLLEGSKIELFTGGSIKNIIRRRQDLSKTYFRNGAFYLFKPDLLFAAEPSLYGEDVRGYVLDGKYSLDIDTPEDWAFAENQMKKILEEEPANA